MKAQQFAILAIFIAGMGFGAVGGNFHGKADILGSLLSDKIECALTINPMTQEALK